MKRATWKIIDRGNVPRSAARMISFHCCNCGHDAELPVVGLPMAQVGQGIVFDLGRHEAPAIVQCRKCRKVFALADLVAA